MRSIVLSFLSFISLTIVSANDPVLMKINGQPVHKSEFEYIYNKNNSNNALDKKTLTEYVDLFINFKLKVEEAKAQGIDTTKTFINELAGYRTQLTKPYLTDANVDEKILREAYDRTKEDVEVSHILIRFPQNPSPKDTLEAWKKIQNIGKRLEKEDFGKVAAEVSEDQMAAENKGYIGFITAFRTVYPFETVAYNTPVGKTSAPVRTMFGYHIIKVHSRRNSPGEILVSHIMRFTEQGNDAKNAAAKTTIDSLYKAIQAGADFAKLATEMSDDKGSATRNGELPWFSTGRMVPEFETAAFALNNKGDISKPIQSAYGWHIIKLLDQKALPTFEASRLDIENKVKRDERANMGQASFINKLKKEYALTVNQKSLDEFTQLLEGKTLNDSAFVAQAMMLENTLLSYSNKNVTQKDFANFLKNNPATDKKDAQSIVDEKLDLFVNETLLAYEDTQLEKKHEDFRFLMQEYHDGILLFEVSNNEVWEKASSDVEGLRKYFDQNKNDYKWEKSHYKGRVISCKDKATFKAAKAIVKKSHTDSIDKYLRTRLNDSIQYVKIEKGLFVEGENKAIDKFGFKVKKADFTPSEEYPYVFVVGKLLKNTPEDYSDVRGLVTADYQEYLEKEWIKYLRGKFVVETNKDVLNSIIEN